MNYTLRQYQHESVEASVQFLRNGRKNGIVVMPTGSGKSLIIANIVASLDAPCLVFQPTREILEQNLAKFEAYGFRPAVYSAAMDRKSVGEITLATIGSVSGVKGEKVQRASKAHLFKDFPYIIVDECHLVSSKEGQYKAFFNEVPARLLGLTATPYRLAKNSRGSELRFLTRTKPRIFSEVVYYVQTKDLFDEGYLARPEYKINKNFNRAALKYNSTGMDYTDQSVKQLFDRIGFKDKVVRIVERLLGPEGQRTNVLVFTRFVEESEYAVRELEKRGVNAALVTGETPKTERAAIIREFRAGRIQAVCNAKVLSVGFDYPELDTVVIARPTLSLALYYQMSGRVLRPHINKQSAWIVDMVGLVDTFGKIEDLTLHENDGKWFYATGDRQLTNTPLSDRGSSRCRKCGSSLLFWARNTKTGNMAPISRPTNGIKPNVNISTVSGKTYYTVVEPGSGEFCVHYALCTNR